jgi:ribose transport system substrate-binding protein
VAKAEGLISDYVVLNGDGSVAQQNSQLAELILRGVDAIAINAASETALNGIVRQACDAGIAVIAFDSLVTEPCAYRLGFNFTEYKTAQAEATLDLIGNQGNVIVVRGVAGSGPDEQMYAAQMAVLAQHPEVDGRGRGDRPGHRLRGSAGHRQHPAEPAPRGRRARAGRLGRLRHRPGLRAVRRPYAEDMPVIEGGGSSDFIIWWNSATRRRSTQPPQ